MEKRFWVHFGHKSLSIEQNDEKEYKDNKSSDKKLLINISFLLPEDPSTHFWHWKFFFFSSKKVYLPSGQSIQERVKLELFSNNTVLCPLLQWCNIYFEWDIWSNEIIIKIIFT